MLKIFRNLSLISKDEFDQSLYLCTCQEDTSVPKLKYITPIIQCLKGQDSKILPLDAFNRIYDLLSQVTYTKWIQALKVAYLLYHTLENRCNVFIEAVCINKLFDKIKLKQLKKPEDAVQLHFSQLVHSLYMYLQYRFEHFMYFENALADFNQKQDYQKTFIIHKMVQSLQLLVKLHKDLVISLEKFPNFLIVRHLLYCLLSDLTFFYPRVSDYLISKIGDFFTLDHVHADKFYQIYTDTIKLSRNVNGMLKLAKELPAEFNIPIITIYNVDQNINRQIELHIKDIKKQQKEKQLQLDIIHFDDEQDQEESSTPPKQLLQQFQKLVASRSHIILPTEPEPDVIMYQRKPDQQMKTERTQLPTLQTERKYGDQSMLQSIVSTSDNSNAKGLSHQNSFRTEFHESTLSPLGFLNFSKSKQ